MLLGLLAAIALAPVYWLVVPARWRRDVLAAASLLALGLFDPRLPLLLLVCTFGLAAVLRGMAAGTDARRRALGVLAVALLVALFVVNKLAGGRLNVLPAQSGVLFLGVSFLVLKMAGAAIDGARGTLGPAGVRDVLAWLVFLPTYPSGPMETFAHFRDQSPAWERLRGLGGLERILFGLVKAQVFAHQLGEWVDPSSAHPGPPVRPYCCWRCTDWRRAFFLIWRATATSPSGWPRSTAKTSPRTSIARPPPAISPSSGSAGTSRSPAGCARTCSRRWRVG